MQESIGLPSAILLAATLWAAGAVTVANRDFVVRPNGNDYYDGGTGTDMISYEGELVPVSVDLSRERADGEGIESDVLVNLENVTGGRAGDILHGSGDNNLLRGMNGNDELFGAAGRDVLEGGRGDDALGGGRGGDRYVFGPGDGNDHIFESHDEGPEDVLVLDADRDSISLQRWGEALLVSVTVGETRDLIVVWDQFLPAVGSGIESIALSNESLDLSVLAKDIDERSAFACLIPWLGSDCPARPTPAFLADQS